MTDAGTSSGTEVLEPSSRVVALSDGPVTLRPITVDLLPAMVRHCRPIIERLTVRGNFPKWGEPGLMDLALELLEHDLADAVDAITVASRLPRERVAQAALDDFLLLAGGVLEENRDFFLRRLAPLLVDLVAKSRGAGKTPSSSSSSTGTG